MHDKPFMRYDSKLADSSRFIVFTSEFKLSFFYKIETRLIDGSFRIAPTNFDQLFTIHGLFIERAYPIFYIILRNKTQELYVKAFEEVKRIIEIILMYIITEHELALIKMAKILLLVCLVIYMFVSSG